MPAISRLGDVGSYHDQYPDTIIIQGSDNVDLNSLPVVRQGDALNPHEHSRHLAKGSSSCDVNSRGLGFVTCPVDCGGFLITGSPNAAVD